MIHFARGNGRVNQEEQGDIRYTQPLRRIVYQDHTNWRGGNVKYVELDRDLTQVGKQGERFILIDPPPDPPLKDRYRGAEFYLENNTLYMYSSASSNPRIIVYATANAVPDSSSKARTQDSIFE